MGKPLLYSFFNAKTAFSSRTSDFSEVQNNPSVSVNSRFLQGKLYTLLIAFLCSFISIHEISAQTASNICPATTVNLMTKIDSTTKPLGAIVTWHTGTPATALNRVSNPTAALAGTYYATYYDGVAMCYGGTVGPLTVTINSCIPMNYTNVCPLAFVDLMSKVDSTAKPVGSFVSWHTGTPATAANRVANPSMVGTSGAYYVAYFDPISNCYGSTSVAANVTINTCPPSVFTLTNTCPSTTVNLNTKVDSTSKPAGTFVSWHTGTPATAANRVANPTAVGTSGSYYVAYFDPISNCFGGTSSALTVTVTVCTPPLAIVQPTPTTKTPNTPVTGTAPTDLTPTGGVGTLTYSDGTNDPLCTVPSGSLALPVSSNLTVNASTGAYSYTTPSTPGTYVFCIKVCDSATPTPNCVLGKYTVTVPSSPLAIVQPTPTIKTPNTPVTGIAPTDLVPTGGTGTLTYSDGTNDPLCTVPSGSTALPASSNLTVNASTGAYSYTTPSTPGTYVFCIKVCDSATPTPNCVLGKYTVTVPPSPLAIVTPPTQTGLPNTPKTGIAPTDLTPTGGTGTLTYSDGTNDPLCTVPSGSTALPASSNLTVNASTGAYSYTTPSTPGTYVFCIKVCDSATPTPNCVLGKYTVTVAPPPCNAGTTALTLTGTAQSNVCPATTADLNSMVSGTCPVGSSIEWHTTNTGLSAATTVLTPTAVLAGTYYPVCHDVTNMCYSPAPYVGVTVTIVAPCPTTSIVKNNICPATTVNLLTQVNITTAIPVGTTVSYHTGTPATAANEVASPSAVTAGFYYVAYKDAANNCYSPTGTAIQVIINGCPPLTPIAKTNICPATSVNLLTQVNLTTALPAGTTLSWHTGTPATAANEIANPSIVTAGIYYPAYKDAANNCYSPTGNPIQVTINACPPLPPIAKTNICPATTVNLLTQVTLTVPVPLGTTVSYHTGTPATAANQVANPSSVGAGMYYVAYKDALNNCYSPTAPIQVTINTCPVVNINCPNPLAVASKTNPTTCGGTDGSISVSGLTASTTYSVSYQLNGGTPVLNSLTADLTGKVTITGLGIGSYTKIKVVFPCKSDSVSTALFGPASCIPPVVTVQDTTKKVCVPLVNLGPPNSTVSACSGYPLVAGASATVTNVAGQICITYVPKPGYSGTDSVCVRVCDPVTGVCSEIKVPVTIQPIPLAINDINATMMNMPVSGSVATNDTKILPTDTFAQLTNLTQGGSIVFNPNGTYTYTPATGFVGKDSIRYSLCSAGNCTLAWLYLTVVKPDITKNLPPVAQNDVAQTNMGVSVAGNLVSNDFDPEGGPLRTNIVPVVFPTHGTVTINPNGTYVYTPVLGYIGTDTFKYEVCDELNQCVIAEATIYIRPDLNGPNMNDKPNAQDDSYRTPMNIPVTGNIRNNDSDPNGDILATTVVTPAAHGTFALNSTTGAFTYTPTPGYYGPDQVKYKACDPSGLCDTATVYIVVEPPVPNAQLDINITNVNQPVSGNILTNDNGGGLAMTLNTTPIKAPSHGTITILPNGNYTYTPAAGFVGKDSIRYVICNAAALCDTAWLMIQVINPNPAINDAPIANDDVAQTQKNTPVNGKVTNNDLDPDGDPLTASVVTQPANGTLVLNPDGTYTYTPNPNFTGKDKFQYQVCDAQGACDTACVVITITPDINGAVNDKPNAQDDAAITQMGKPVTSSLRPNDSDPNGNALTYTTTPVTPPTNGTVSISTGGNYTYTPAPGFYGTDKFRYRVCDNGAPSLCDTATVYITVMPNSPDAQNDINITFVNKPVSGNVLTNDSNNGLPMTANPVLTVPASNGVLTLTANGTYTYQPALNFVGKDSAQYVVCNVASRCDTAWIYVTVISPSLTTNNPPIAQNDNAQTLMNQPVPGKVTNNDIDPDGDPLTATLLGQPSNGGVIMNPDGTYTYQPDPGFVGTDKFCYKVCDSKNACDSACVTVTVSPDLNGNANDKPNAQDDAVLTKVNTPVSGSMKPNDSDPNGNTLTYTTTPVSAPTNGTVTISSNGNYVYTPANNYAGTDKFTYKVCDNGVPSLCDTATVYITITPAKIDAVNDIANTPKNTSVSGNVQTNDDPQGQPVITGIISGDAPKHGVVTINPNGSYTYTPTTGYVGKDSVRYVMCVNEIPLTKCDTAYIYFNVIDTPTTQNDKPIASNDVATTPQGTPVKGNVLGNDQDPDGDPLTASVCANPSNGTLVLSPNGNYTYTPIAGFVGKDTFKYKVCDNGNPVKCDTGTVEIEVKAIVPPAGTNIAPQANDDALITKMDTPKSGNVGTNDIEPNAGQVLTFTQLTSPPNGTLVFNNTTGAYTFSPSPGFVGNTSFKYKVCDNGNPVKCDSATVMITVLTGDKITKPLAINDINVTFVNVPVAGNALTNDEANGNTVTTTLVSGANGTPKHGAITLLPNGEYFYTPATGFIGKDSVQYSLCNNLIPVECDLAWIYVTIAPYPSPTENDKPIAMPDVAVTDKGKPVSGNVLGNDIDPDGNPLTVSVVNNPTNGTLVLNPNGTFTYTPNPTFVGTDVFKYKVCDNGVPAKCDTATVTIKVLPIDPTVNPLDNKKPTANDDLVTTQDGKPVTGSAAPNDSDPDLGQTLTFTATSSPTNGSVTMLPDGTFSYVPVPGFVGTDSFTYQVCDNGNPVKCDSATVIIKIDPSSTKPDAVDDINITQTGKPTTGNVLTNDNLNGSPVTVAVTTPPTNGTIVINPTTGAYTYTPTPGFVGKDSVQYKICNNQIPTECDSAWIFINVAPTPLVGFNNPPIASHDVNTTPMNTPVTGNVSGNDVEFDAGQTLTFVSLGNPPSGTVVMNPNGSYTYTPAPGFVGNDTFKYKVCDNGNPSLCDMASVTITVNYPTIPPTGNHPPVAVDDVASGQVGKPLTINVGTNDKDPDGNPLVFTAIGGNPNVTISPSGVLTYTPQIDPITGLIIGGNTVIYKVCDNGNPAKCDTATVYLLVTPSTTKPLAVNDINSTPMNTSVTGSVATNDDKKGLPATFTVLTPPSKATVFVMNPDGSYSYLPNTNFVGKDSVRYQICNNLVPVECSTAWLYINVIAPPTTSNDKPVANPDAVQTLANTPITSTVLNNDTDPEGQPLTATVLSPTSNGTLVLNPNGTYTYTPAIGFIGKDKFKYQICDNGNPVKCDTASVTIDVNPKTTPAGANDAPMAQDDAVSSTKNIPVTGSAAPNDFEPNAGQTLTFTTISSPLNGTVTMQANGTFTYTPANNFVGGDSFKYKVCDNGSPSKCDTATVYVTILPTPVPSATAPLAINDINLTPKNTAVTGNILTNDDKKGLPVTTTILTPAVNGTLVLGANGAYTYTPNNNFVGKDSVRYEICNNKVPAECDQAWVYITVISPPATTPTNPPIAMPDVNQTLVNKPVSGTVANNDSDPDLGQLLSYTKLTNPLNGTIAFNGVTGAYTYTPNTGFVGTDMFTYRVCDNGSPVQCASTTVTIKVTPDYSNGGNIKPVANDDLYSTNKGVGVSGNASFNDSDPNAGQTLSYAAISIPANGTVTMNADGSFAYAPNATFVGTDKFLYKICDNGIPQMCDTATIYISVNQPQAVTCVTFTIKALLEGPYSTSSGKMTTTLNQRGLLPGQTPIGQFAIATPNGQPYSGAPWNYAGTEAMPVGGYPATVTDWVLVSLRTDETKASTVFRAAALLHEDGTISFLSPCISVPNGSYYVLVEHRNHMGVMSPTPVPVTNGVLTHDFTLAEGYTTSNPPSFGQKVKGTTNPKFVMYAGDLRKALSADNYDINSNDSSTWKIQSGVFDQYRSGDLNLNADTNSNDSAIWKANSGKYSAVQH